MQRPFVLGYVGRLVAEKGIGWLLESWAAADLPPDAMLVFVGAGPMEIPIRQASSRDSRIRILGAVSFSDVPNVMAALDALALPSLTTPTWCEQFGRVITEAMAAGVTLIASDSGAIPEVTNNAAVIVREGSIEALAGAINRMATDVPMRQRLARAGVQRAAEEFAPEVGAARLAAFWNQVMELPRLG